MPAGVLAQRLDGDIDALRERLTREARDAQARIVERGAARLLGEGDPDLVRLLRGEVVQAKRRQQADDGGRDPRRDDRGRGVGRELVAERVVMARVLRNVGSWTQSPTFSNAR